MRWTGVVNRARVYMQVRIFVVSLCDSVLNWQTLKQLRWTSWEAKSSKQQAELESQSFCIRYSSVIVAQHVTIRKAKTRSSQLPHPYYTPLVIVALWRMAVEGAAPSLVIIRIRSLGDAAFVFSCSAVCVSTSKSATNHNPQVFGSFSPLRKWLRAYRGL